VEPLDAKRGKKNEIESIFSVPTGSGKTAQGGYRYKHCFASYVHLHFGSNPTMAEGWVEAIRNRVHKSTGQKLVI